MATKIPAEVKEELDAFTKDIKGLLNVKPAQFDVLSVATMISRIPERKWNAAQGVVNATIAKKAADQKYKVKKSEAALIAAHRKAELELTAAADRQQWVESRPDVQEAEVEVINAEAELISAKFAYECLDDLFTAGKRIMQYLIDQEKATQEYNRFSDEASRNR